jgi:hypothetical protein
MEAKTRQLHRQESFLAGRESPCRDNTIEGNVGVGGESLLAPLMARDNGFAVARGQSGTASFPKPFAEVIRENES